MFSPGESSGLPITAGGCPYYALIDSGADLNLIRAS